MHDRRDVLDRLGLVYMTSFFRILPMNILICLRSLSGRMLAKRLLAGLLLAAVSGAATASPPVSTTEPAPNGFRLSGVTLRRSSYHGGAAFEMRMPSSAYQDPAKEKLSDRDFMAWLPLDFQNGTIEVEVASDLAPDAPDFARGFIGLAFRIDRDGRFESIYLRPTNSMSEDQVRRNHSVQYVAYPDYRFDRLRREAPEKYETYAEISTGRWIAMRIVVEGTKATLYLDGRSRPAFVVQDLKLGADQRGGVGIWLETGTIAHFRKLRVVPAR